MINKVLVKVIVPELDDQYDVFIPVNELIWKIKKLITKSVGDLSGISLDQEDYVLINKNNGKVYNNNDVVINTDIRNSTELIIFSVK